MQTIRRLLRALRSLQWQLAASYAAMAALLCWALGVVIMFDLGHILVNQDRTDVQSRAVIVGDLIYRSLTPNANLQLILDEASQYSHARVCSFDANDTLHSISCSSAGLIVLPDSSSSPEVDDQVTSNPTPIAPYAAITGGQSSSVFGYVTLDHPLTFRQETERTARAAIFRLSLVATAIAAGAGLLLGRGLTAPLRALTEASRALGSHLGAAALGGVATRLTISCWGLWCTCAFAHARAANILS